MLGFRMKTRVYQGNITLIYANLIDLVIADQAPLRFALCLLFLIKLHAFQPVSKINTYLFRNFTDGLFK